MGTKEDREHFESYRRQTQIKHLILLKYVPAFFTVLKQHNKNLVYIDAFAGRGYYTDSETGKQHPGSPIQVLSLLASTPDLSNRTTAIFAEKDKDIFESLQIAVGEFCEKETSIKKPILRHETFEQLVEEIKQHFGGEISNIAPTFLFVDPCGISGAAFNSIVEIVRLEFCEAFIFFNFVGLQRTAGLLANGTLSETVIQMFGSEQSARNICAQLNAPDRTTSPEEIAVNAYKELLIQRADAEFVIPFRIESEHRRATSHYLIHVSKHQLGFKIMKDVMWNLGIDEESGDGLEYLQKSADKTERLFDVQADEVDKSILLELKNGPCLVEHFCDVWAGRATDLVAPKYYKRRLIALEHDNLIEVCKNGVVKDASSRRKIKKQTTLANHYEVRLRINP